MVSAARVALLKAANDQHRAQIALMKFLSDVARKERVGDHVYVVGGAVRNFVIDRPIKDIDVVIDTVALGERFRKTKDSEWFAKTLQRRIPARTDLTTNQYGVAILTVKGDWEVDGHNLKDEVIEIANARKESYGGSEGKGYKPDEVVPATIEEDLLRREFTFNTLLWRLQDVASGPEKAEIVDLTGCGLRDLNNMTMRCPRDPDIVFADDPTRMLRAIKFATKYGFKIPDDLAASIRKNAQKMKQAPWEAIATIFINNVLNEPTAPKALRQMKSLGLLDVVAEMVQEQKPFASYLTKQLRNRNVSLLLDLLDLGLSSPSPLGYLTRPQQERLREITVPMDSADADAFVAYLAKPQVDNGSLIRDFGLQGPQRALPVQYAREALLENPHLMGNRGALDSAIRDMFRSRGKTAKELLPGGKGRGRSPSDFDPDELEAGIKVEHEHLVGDGYSKQEAQAIAREIAMDHLTEIPDYYTRLDKMESEAGVKHAVTKKAKTYSRIAMYDFDGTLFRSWESTPPWWEGTHLDDRPYSFFVKPESLGEPCVPEKPPSKYWISNTVKNAQRDSRDRSCLVVVVTGRVKVHKPRVLELLRSKGINPDLSYFNPGMSAAKFKVAVLKNLLVGYNTVDRIDIWENENQTIYQTALEQAAKVLGRKIEVNVHTVHVPPEPLICGPEDFGLTEVQNLALNYKRVAARFAKLAAKKYEHIDFKPPAGVAAEAEKGLEYRRQSGKGGLSSQEAGKQGIGSGVQRAVNLKNRNNIAPDTIQQMLNFFSRHEKNKAISPENRGTPEKDAGYVAWLLWGGDAGLAWAKKIKKQMDAADAKAEGKSASVVPPRGGLFKVPEHVLDFAEVIDETLLSYGVVSRVEPFNSGVVGISFKIPDRGKFIYIDQPGVVGLEDHAPGYISFGPHPRGKVIVRHNDRHFGDVQLTPAERRSAQQEVLRKIETMLEGR